MENDIPPTPHACDSNDESDEDVDVSMLESMVPPKPFLMQFQQQRLPTFYLAPTVTFTLVALTISWVLCGLISAVFLVENDKFKSVSFRYDNAIAYSFPIGEAQNDTDLLRTYTVQTDDGPITSSQGRQSVVQFVLTEKIPGPVTMFYVLDPFYQNFRSFAESGSDSQLLGNVVAKSDLYLCAPFRSPGEYYKKDQDRIDTPITVDGIRMQFSDVVYSPCGVKPWSMFNDTVVIEELRTDGRGGVRCNSSDFDAVGNRLTLSEVENPCRKKGIAWSIDYDRFKPAPIDPKVWTGDYKFATDNDFLANGWYYNEAGHSLPNQIDEDLWAWLATSSTSTTRKVWRILDGDMEAFDSNGAQIQYRMVFDEFYPTYAMNVEKRVVFTGVANGGSAWLAAPNRQFVYPLLVTAGFSFVSSILIFIHCMVGKVARKKNVVKECVKQRGVDPDFCFKTTPSTTVEESLEPDSFESGQYVALCTQKQLDWERQKREADRYAVIKQVHDEREKVAAEELATQPTSIVEGESEGDPLVNAQRDVTGAAE